MSYQDIIPLVLSETIGDMGYKIFANNGGVLPFVSGSIGYLGVIYYLIRSLQGSSILLVNAAWDGVSTVFEAIPAYFILGERFTSYREFFGFILIVVGLFLMKLPVSRKKEFVFPKIFG
jgi:multidrug transporter EmrE-like cation transporter